MEFNSADLLLFMPIIFYGLAGLVLGYLVISLFLTYLVQEIPRHPVTDAPDWGSVVDTIIPAIDGGSLEVWRIDPEAPSRGIVVFAHGWGRNRDRMVKRARQFAEWGFTTVIHSARDHGNSSPKRFMNAVKFAEDIEAVLKWVNAPVLLYGHSAGSAGAILAASRNPSTVQLLFLEASYAHTKEALMSLYRWVNPVFGNLFGPMIILWMSLFYKGELEKYSPARLAKQIKMPVMIIHGMKDQRFPVSFALQLKQSFLHDKVACYLAKDAGHSDASLTKGYNAAIQSFMAEYLDVADNSASE
ncbi:alpha/beta fold hydrolase [Desulfobacula sp.]|uniref:alpha/beta hydrolase n=1 Tax=Desulfobacula sp. TaxID=2593537 RepID=UPI0026226399|nr:alpha/beta fold hydrolase [Desulfobacula sp.]